MSQATTPDKIVTIDNRNKLSAARRRLLILEPEYGHAAMQMTWTPSREIPTMAVRIMRSGPECIWNPEFVEKLTVEELYGVVQHEIEHIIRLHCIRVFERNQLGWNIACDISVNGHKANPKVGYKSNSGKRKLPDDAVYCPNDCQNDLTADEYYDKFKSDQTFGGKVLGKSDTQDKDGQHNEIWIDDHSMWDRSDASADESRQIVRGFLREVSQKTMGKIPGEWKKALDGLSQPIVNWRSLLHMYIGRHAGSRRVTYSRRSRRYTEFGIPGTTRHASSTVNIIVDTSGSVSDVELKQFFSEVESIASHHKINLLQWDAAFQGFSRYRRGDWKTKLKIGGRGGTDMVAPLKYLIDNRLVGDVQVMMTDGECSWSDPLGFNLITVITTDRPGPSWGSVVRLKV